MEKKVKITIGQKLKKKLDWQILSKNKDYDSHIWALVIAAETQHETLTKYPEFEEKLGEIYRKHRHEFLKKNPKKGKNHVIRIAEE